MGSLYKGDKKQKGQQGKAATAPPPASAILKSSKAAYVEDVPDSPNPSFVATSVPIEAVPPPAPSPPAVTEDSTPVNVFDYLQPDSPASSASSASSYKSIRQNNALPQQASNPTVTPAPTRKDPLFTYGNAPIPTSTNQYDSDHDVPMSDIQQAPSSTQKTPAPVHASSHQSASQSDKKRKRGSLDDHEANLVRTARSKAENDGRTVLHSGLTGGLNKLLTDHEAAQASPLSPKKRSKHAKDGSKKDSSTAAAAEAAAAAAAQETRLTVKPRGDLTQKDGKPTRRSDRHTTSTSRALEPTSSRTNGALSRTNTSKTWTSVQLTQRPEQSHSEFFLGLIDKGPESSKGQSVWGVMKMFHEGLLVGGGGGGVGLDAGSGAGNIMEMEDKRLFRGLRMKRGKAGEIIIFARPEAELDG